MIERLEARRLFAIAVVDGIPTVTGTEGDDRIELFHPSFGTGWDDQKVTVRFNGVIEGTFDVDRNNPPTIRIDALGGNDYVYCMGDAGEGFTGGLAIRVPTEIQGGAGKDTLIGSERNDTIVGGNGNDALFGNGGDDLVAGGKGNDYLGNTQALNETDDGDDILGGGDGDDTLSGSGFGADAFEGGRGIDTADYSGRNTNLLIALGVIKLPPTWSVQVPEEPSTIAQLQVWPPFDPHALFGTGFVEGDFISDDVENAVGGNGHDVIWGSVGNNVLSGGGGNDQIYSGAGTDVLYGNDGNDRLYSADRNIPSRVDPSSRSDRVHGGAGRDFAMIDAMDLDTVVKVEQVQELQHLIFG